MVCGSGLRLSSVILPRRKAIWSSCDIVRSTNIKRLKVDSRSSARHVPLTTRQPGPRFSFSRRTEKPAPSRIDPKPLRTLSFSGSLVTTFERFWERRTAIQKPQPAGLFLTVFLILYAAASGCKYRDSLTQSFSTLRDKQPPPSAIRMRWGAASRSRSHNQRRIR